MSRAFWRHVDSQCPTGVSHLNVGTVGVGLTLLVTPALTSALAHLLATTRMAGHAGFADFVVTATVGQQRGLGRA